MENRYFHSHNAAICLMSIPWNEARHSTHFKTSIDPPELFTQVKLPFRNKWHSPIVFRRVTFQGERKWLVKRWAEFSRGRLFNFHVHKFSYSMTPFGKWLSAGQIMIKWGHTHTVTAAVCRIFRVLGPEPGLKMSLWAFLIFKKRSRLIADKPRCCQKPLTSYQTAALLLLAILLTYCADTG